MPERSSLRYLASSLALAAAFACCGGAASAQSTGARPAGKLATPRISTRMSDAEAAPVTPESAHVGNPLLVDFDRSETVPAPAAPEKDLDQAKPEAATAAETIGGQPCSTGDAMVDTLVLAASARFGVDPCFVVAVIGAESAGDRYAVSPKGACGYMQLMPDTARRFGVTDIFDPRQNIYAGTEYLRWLLDRFNGSMELALAGYNAGENAVAKYGNCIPPFAETQNYVRIITSRYLTHRAGLVIAPTSASASAPRPSPPPQVPVVHNLVVEFEEPPNP
jgi:hypothetical protein